MIVVSSPPLSSSSLPSATLSVMVLVCLDVGPEPAPSSKVGLSPSPTERGCPHLHAMVGIQHGTQRLRCWRSSTVWELRQHSTQETPMGIDSHNPFSPSRSSFGTRSDSRCEYSATTVFPCACVRGITVGYQLSSTHPQHYAMQ